MRYLFFLLILIFTNQVSSAQNHAEKKLIRFAIGKENIWYGERIRERDIDAFRNALSNNTLLFNRKYAASYEKDGVPDSLVFVLTKADQVLINRQLDQMKGFTWKKNLFENALAVNIETIGTDKKFNPDDYKNGGYAFTKPVLIRNKTVGFIYISHNSVGTVIMYVRDKNEWTVKYLLASMVIETK
jgi:hypothetical protein